MQHICRYHIEVRSDLDEDAFNIASPVHIKLVEQSPDSARFMILADQSGLIGLIRHLHRQGIPLLSITRSEEIIQR